MSSVRVFKPVGLRVEENDESDGPAPIPELREGLAVGIVENTKPNAGELMNRTASLLAERIPGLHITIVRKNSAAEGVSDEAFGRLAQEAAIILVGSAD